MSYRSEAASRRCCTRHLFFGRRRENFPRARLEWSVRCIGRLRSKGLASFLFPSVTRPPCSLRGGGRKESCLFRIRRVSHEKPAGTTHYSWGNGFSRLETIESRHLPVPHESRPPLRFRLETAPRSC